MFKMCVSLKKLNVENFDMTNVDDYNYLFESCQPFELILGQDNGKCQNLIINAPTGTTLIYVK